jgi:Flavin containing amine oxidoreductase
VAFEVDGREHAIAARAAVVATPAYVARRIVADLPGEVARALEGVSYGPYVVGAFLTGETAPMPYDDVYAAATPSMSFNMLFNTANLLRGGGRRAAGGTLMVYAAAGLARALADQSDAQVERRFVDDICRLFPTLRGQVREAVIHRWEAGLPHPRPGRRWSGRSARSTWQATTWGRPTSRRRSRRAWPRPGAPVAPRRCPTPELRCANICSPAPPPHIPARRPPPAGPTGSPS